MAPNARNRWTVISDAVTNGPCNPVSLACGKCALRMLQIGISKAMALCRPTPAERPDILQLSRLIFAIEFRPCCQTDFNCRLCVGEGQSPPGKDRADNVLDQSLVLLDIVSSCNQAILEKADPLVRRPQKTELLPARQCRLKLVQFMIGGHLGAVGFAPEIGGNGIRNRQQPYPIRIKACSRDHPLQFQILAAGPDRDTAPGKVARTLYAAGPGYRIHKGAFLLDGEQPDKIRRRTGLQNVRRGLRRQTRILPAARLWSARSTSRHPGR